MHGHSYSDPSPKQPGAASGDDARPRHHLGYLRACFSGFGPRIALTVFFLAIARAAATADPLLFKAIIDGLGDAKARGDAFAELGWIVPAYFGLRGVTLVGEHLRDWVFAPVEMGVGRRVSETVFDYLLRLPVSYHAEQKTGALARRIGRGSRAITFILDFLVMNILPTLVELVFVTLLLARLYPPSYGLITVFTVILYTCFTVWSTEKRQKYRLNANRADDQASGIQIDSVANIETVKYFQNEDLARKNFGSAIQRWFELSVRSNQIFAAITTGQNAILLLGLGAILFLGIRQAAQGELTVGDLVVLSTYVVRLSTPIGTLGFIYRGMKDGYADLDEMGKIFENEITVAEPVRPVPIPNPEGAVKFDGVEFCYAGREPVLKGIHLDIPAGARVAVVGPSGAGKSTLARLLFRFHDPTAGSVTLDGVDLRDLSCDTRRSILAIVPQEPVLFNDTIAGNLRFGKPTATHQEIQAACRLANIHDFIAGLPEGYETLVGERGVKLSGGEKQRVAIARALIRDPRVLVFDEATSSLDTHSERLIQESMARITEHRTTLVIAHRLSTIVDADRIYVLKDGSISEQGTHDELVQLGGEYAHLWSLQAPSELGSETASP